MLAKNLQIDYFTKLLMVVLSLVAFLLSFVVVF